MTGLLISLAGAYGVHLIFSNFAFGWHGVAPGPAARTRGPDHRRVKDWLVQAGLAEAKPVELAAVVALCALMGGTGTWLVFGGFLPPLVAGAVAACFPVAAARSRRERRRHAAREAWPRLIEEIRIATGTLGRSIPQAVLDVGRRAPAAMVPAFDAARREWLLSTDFEACLTVLKTRLADATADAVCETLLVAHQIGGNDVDRCLVALIEDRIADLQGRKDARARQAGARFARSFTIVVPLGMALIGLSIGTGRSAYGSATGQVLVVFGLVLMALCWAWASQIMRLPSEDRVLAGTVVVDQ